MKSKRLSTGQHPVITEQRPTCLEFQLQRVSMCPTPHIAQSQLYQNYIYWAQSHLLSLSNLMSCTQLCVMYFGKLVSLFTSASETKYACMLCFHVATVMTSLGGRIFSALYDLLRSPTGDWSIKGKCSIPHPALAFLAWWWPYVFTPEAPEYGHGDCVAPTYCSFPVNYYVNQGKFKIFLTILWLCMP